jgi:hypothetical protein
MSTARARAGGDVARPALRAPRPSSGPCGSRCKSVPSRRPPLPHFDRIAVPVAVG